MDLTEAPTPRSSIRVLSPELAQKIAAGEVVERPVSVVKEVVENSLDACAKHVRVEIEDGGKKRISVLDDGFGIVEDELLLALERHATSKIKELDDLWDLHTMGFRGEALPSIASVSRFTLESRVLGASGRRVYLEGGRLARDETPSAQSPLGTQGTWLSVEDLFYNVPARLKFLRAKSSESALIRELLERIALCNPEVGFTLVSEGKRTLQLSPSTLEKRVEAVLEAPDGSLEAFEGQFEDIHVRGWLERDARAVSSKQIHLSVNGRMVRDKLLQQAVTVALRPRMMEGEFPKIFLEVSVPPSLVDVNVHPAKTEVRFHRGRDVFQVVHGALDRLARSVTKPFYSARLPSEAPAARAHLSPELGARPTVPTLEEFALDSKPASSASSPEPTAPLFERQGLGVSFKIKREPELVSLSTDSPPDTPGATTQPLAGDGPGFTRLHYIGQLKNTYLLFQDDDALVLIDQHAAHERVNYERIKAEFLSQGLRPQPLLLSCAVKARPEDVTLALDNAVAFGKLGFELEAFGESSILLRSIPEGLEPARAQEVFRALLEELRDAQDSDFLTENPSRLSAKLERMLATAACHSSIRAGQSLAPREARELALQMEATESSLNCPHGRPASVRLTFGQIEGLFKRS